MVLHMYGGGTGVSRVAWTKNEEVEVKVPEEEHQNNLTDVPTSGRWHSCEIL